MKKIKLMTHVVVGYPSLEATVELVKTMVASGVDMMELQIPFSDPLADGPTIMKACEESLKHETKVKDAFRVMGELTEFFNAPTHVILGRSIATTPESTQKDLGFKIHDLGKDSGRTSFARMTKSSDKMKSPVLLFMAYYNTLFNYGVEKFIRDAKKAGCEGLIVPDMPIDEEDQEHFYEYCKKYGMHAIPVVSPASTNERLEKIVGVVGKSPFVYATARQGITGVQKGQRSRIKDQRDFLKRVRKYFTIPVAVGFGISTKEQVQSLQGYADIAVIGSALIDIINNSSEKLMIRQIKEFILSLK